MHWSRVTCVFAVLAAVAAPAGAAVLEWPGAAPCNATLQACVDAAASGDTIVVVSEATITGGVAIGAKSLVLRAAPGLRPALAAGTGISASGAAAGSVIVTVEGFALRDARISLAHFGASTARFTVRNNEIHASSRAASAGIDVRNAGTGTSIVQIEDNRITTGTPTLNGAALRLTSGDGTLEGQVVHNHLLGLPANAAGWGILLDAVGGSTMEVAIGFNELRGEFRRSAIGVSEGLFSATASQLNAHIYSNAVVCSGTFAQGIGSVLNTGDIDVDIGNNTIVSCETALGYSRWGGSPGGGGIGGDILSNIIAHNQRGLFLNPEFNSSVNEFDNLFWDNPFNQPAPDTGSILADPLFLSPQHPFLRDGSPAIDSAHPFTPLLQTSAGLRSLDAAGLRRVRGSQVDMGAYEHGDTALVHTTTLLNTVVHITRIQGAPFDGEPGARLQVTPSYDGGSGPEGPLYSQPFGVYLSGGFWQIFSQDFAPIPTGARFNVFAPKPGNGVFSHVSSAASIDGWHTKIDNLSINNKPERFVLATQNWSLGGASIYNPHPIGVFYRSVGGPGSWYVSNLDQLPGQDMPVDVGFNIYAQDRSPNAFLAEATPTNVLGQTLFLQHPLLDGTPCAQPQVTRVSTGSPVTSHFDVRYHDAEQRWTIHNHNTPMPPDAQFFVLVNPHQVTLCKAPLFRNGFE